MRAAAFVVLVAVMLATPSAGQPPAPKALTDAQKEKLKEAARYGNESVELEKTGAIIDLDVHAARQKNL